MAARMLLAFVSLVIALVVPVISQASSARYTYVERDSGWCGDWCYSEFDTPIVRVPVPGDTLHMWPRGQSFTINIDDFGTLDGGDVWVEISSERYLYRGCMTVRSTKTISGVAAGALVRVYIGSVGQHHPGDNHGCSSSGTAGVVTVSGAS